MTLKEILQSKGSAVHCVTPDVMLSDAVQKLVEHNVGSLVVVAAESEEPKPVGIITERDVLRHCGSGKCNIEPTKVADVMTSNLVTASPDDRVEQVMGVMTKHRLRHLPVCDKGRLVGMISIGDVVKAQHDRLALENQFMKDYIQS